MSGLSFDLPPETLAAIAEQVAPLLAQQDKTPEPWVGVDEAAAHLACPKSRIYTLVGRRDETRLPHRKEGSRLLFRLCELDSYIEVSR